METKRKKLLVQGAGRGHLGLVRTAKEMGVYIVMTGLPGEYPCLPYADKFCVADITDAEKVLEIAKRESVDGIIICCSDTGLRTVGYVCDQMNLHGLSEESSIISSNKLMMKQALMTADVRTPKYKEIGNIDDLHDSLKELNFPLVIKAIDLQGSRGIYIVKDIDSLLLSFEKVMSETKQNFCIVEEFIKGKEFGAQSFIYNDEILFILPHGDETIMCKTAVPVGHYMPLDIQDTSLYEDILTQSQKAIKAIGLNNCAVNIDFIEKDGKAYIIELTGRVGANCLPELTGNYFGINYYEMIITMALGNDPNSIFDKRLTNPKATLARMITSDKEGIIDSISYQKDSENTVVELFVKKGDKVREFMNSNDGIGQVIVVDETLESCHKSMESFLKQFKIVLS